jgi:iron complex transport system substrate-binding protein
VRICSLLPSATEILFLLGAGDSLVGVSHECDYPAAAALIPKVTRSNIPSGHSSEQIDSAVGSSLQSSGTLYELNIPLLEELRPDLVITQRLCDVCAVSYDLVEDAVAGLSSKPLVLNLEPHSLDDILNNIREVGSAIGRNAEAEAAVASLRQRIGAVRDKTKNLASRPRTFCMEWVSPPFCGGHWMKELVEIAGGRDDLANRNRPSHRIEWDRVVAFAPEVLVLTCCGFDLQRCSREAEILTALEGANDLPAARAGRVYATDGSAYFSRPGPRIVDSLEILAHLIHPEIFPAPALPGAFSSVDITRVRSIPG